MPDGVFPLSSVVHPEQYACQQADHTKDAESSGCDDEYSYGHITCKFQFYGSFCLSLARNQEHRFQYALDCIVDGSREQGNVSESVYGQGPEYILLVTELDTRKIQVLLGHKSIASTQIYTHISSEEASEEVLSSWKQFFRGPEEMTMVRILCGSDKNKRGERDSNPRSHSRNSLAGCRRTAGPSPLRS